MEKDELNGMSPEVIGTYIARIAQKKNCAPICVAGVKYKILRFLCKISATYITGKACWFYLRKITEIIL